MEADLAYEGLYPEGEIETRSSDHHRAAALIVGSAGTDEGWNNPRPWRQGRRHRLAVLQASLTRQ